MEEEDDDEVCFEEKTVTNSKYKGKQYWINLENGKSQWGVPLLSGETLPFGWEKHMSKKLKIYYENKNTGQTQWDKPDESQQELPQINKAWEIKKSRKCGTIYYKHSKTGATQWDVPYDMFGGGTPDNTFVYVNPFGDKGFMFQGTDVNNLKNLNPDNINIPWPDDFVEQWQNSWELTTKKTNITKLGLFNFDPKNLKITSQFNHNGVTNPKNCYVMMNKCKAPADKYIFTKQKMPAEITTIISNIQDEIQRPHPLGRRKMFVLPSQLNAAEYPDQNTIVNFVEEYLTDNSGGPRGQLGADLSIAQFIIDMACNDGRSKEGINNVRLMGNINGVTLKNGYLHVKEDADLKQFEKQLPEMTILGVRDVPVRGLDKSLNNFVNMNHTVDLVYASAVPIGNKYGYGNGDGSSVQRIAQLTLFAQYVGAMRLAVTRKNCNLILMPLGGKYFVNPLENIRSAIINAYNFMKDDLKKADVGVQILAWEDSDEKKEEKIFS